MNMKFGENWRLIIIGEIGSEEKDEVKARKNNASGVSLYHIPQICCATSQVSVFSSNIPLTRRVTAVHWLVEAPDDHVAFVGHHSFIFVRLVSTWEAPGVSEAKRRQSRECPPVCLGKCSCLVDLGWRRFRVRSPCWVDGILEEWLVGWLVE